MLLQKSSNALESKSLIEKTRAVNLHFQYKGFKMVGVAQLVEYRIVAPVVAGSSPVAHPKF
jgi:hypothetical protein